jgi:hypothetical protein
MTRTLMAQPVHPQLRKCPCVPALAFRAISSNLVSSRARGCQGETILAVLMTVPSVPSHTTHHMGANPVHASVAEYPSSLVQFAGLRISGSGPWPQSLFQDGEPAIRSISGEDIPGVTARKFLSNWSSRMIHQEPTVMGSPMIRTGTTDLRHFIDESWGSG